MRGEARLTSAPTSESLRPESRFRVELIGAPRIFAPAGELSPTKPVVFAAALYLLLHRGRTVRRATLAALLWPDADTAARGERLRWLVSQLKQHGVPVQARAADMTLSVGDVSTDMDAIVQAMTVEDVLARGSDALLAGYEPDISDLFSRWLEETRDALRLDLLRALLPWLAAARRGANWSATAQLARRILTLDPFHKQAATALSEAVAMQDTRHADASPRGASAADASLSSRNAPLVGRQDVLERLLAVLGPTADLSRRLAVAGPAGMGKTRLIQEFMALARLRGTQVVSLRCSRGDALRPLSLVIDLARALLEMRGALGADPTSLEVLRGLTGESDDGDEPEQGGARRAVVYSALKDLLGAVADDAPLAVVLDDAQWAEPGSWSILAPMFAQEDESVAWIATLRAATRSDATRLGEPIFPAGEAESERELIWLSPLEHSSVSALCMSRAAPREIQADVMQRLIARAAGIPFVAEALVDHWMETGDLASLPSSVARLVQARLDRVSDGAARTLAAIAVLGEDAVLASVDAVAMLDRATLMEATNELGLGGILRVVEGIFSTHALWTEAVMRRVPDSTLQLMHHTAAEWLEQSVAASGPASSRRSWAAAEHWLAAGDPARAQGALDAAASLLSVSGFAIEAGEMMERAAQIAGDSPAALHYLDRAAALWMEEDADRSSDALHRVQARYDEIAKRIDPVGYSPHHAVELMALSATMRREGGGHESIAQLSTCIHSETASVFHRIDAASRMTTLWRQMNLHEQAAHRRAWDTIGALTPSSDEERVALALFGAGHFRNVDDPDQAHQHIEIALGIVRRENGAMPRYMLVMSYAAMIAEMRGSLVEAQALRREAMEHGIALRRKYLVTRMAEAIVMSALEAGHLDEVAPLLHHLGPAGALPDTQMDRARAIACAVYALEAADPKRARTEFTVPLEAAAAQAGLMPRARVVAIYAHIALLENDEESIAALLPRLLDCFAGKMTFMDHPAYVTAMCLERLDGWDAASRFVRHFMDDIRQERWTPRAEITRYLNSLASADPR